MSATHVAYLGLGANLGDRQVNLARAVDRLRRDLGVERVSRPYETEPVGPLPQPPFINLALAVRTEETPAELLRRLKRIERELGRPPVAQRDGPRPIDIDLLFYDDLVIEGQDLGEGLWLTLPHPRAHARAFVLAPLADIAPELRHPVLGRSVAELLAERGQAGVRRLEQGLLVGFARDLQAEPPRVALGLARVGVTGLERVIRLHSGHPMALFQATMDVFVDLPADRKGAHMSRFPAVLDEAVEALTWRSAADIEGLAARVAEGVLRLQGASRAEVHLAAKVPRTRHAPVSGQKSQDLWTLEGWAVATSAGTARLVGATTTGITACPCAQDMLRAHAAERLAEAGLEPPAAERALAVLPLATHSQRSRGTLVVSSAPEVSADDLLRMVEASMSSEIYELLKRPDELFVVHRAHQNPKFVEDVVRDMLGLALAAYAGLPDRAYLLARQVNFESIHRHDVLAERGALLGDLRRELAGGSPGPSLGLEAYLHGLFRAGGPGSPAEAPQDGPLPA